MLIRKLRGWEIPEREVTPEGVYLNRRELVRSMGFTAAGIVSGLATGSFAKASAQQRIRGVDEAVNYPDWPAVDKYKAKKSTVFTEELTGRESTSENVTLAYNNFYEFRTDKANVWRNVERFETRPWEVEVGGLVNNPQTFDVDDLIRNMPLEERVYRFRCVEAWAATVPWTGFPFRALIERVQPQSAAKYIRMTTP